MEERRVLAGWVESFGGTADEGQNPTQTMDHFGNVYLSGSFNSQPADFDPGEFGTFLMSSAGGKDAFAAKYRADGSFDWARRFGAAGADGIRASAFASETGGDYLYVTGEFEGSVDFGGVPLTSAGGVDLFIAKLNAEDGTTVFAKRIGSLNGSEGVSDLTVANGQVYVGGYFGSNLDFDPGSGSAFRTPAGNGKDRHTDGFVLQLNSNGEYVSSYQFGGGDNDGVWSMASDETSLYLYGNLGPRSRTVDLDPGSAIKNAKDKFIAKYSLSTTSPDWSPVWVGTLGSTLGGGNGSTFTDANSLYLLSNFQGTQDFDPGSGTANLTSAGGNDGFVAKYSKNTGELLWAKQYGGPGLNEWFESGIVVQDVLYLSFRAESAFLDFNPGGSGGEVSGNGAGTYAVLLKIKANGDFQQVWQMGGTNSADFLRSHVIGTFGTSVYVAGYFRATATFPTGGLPLTSTGGLDMFLMALEDPPMAATFTVNPTAQGISVDAALLSILDDLDDSATRKRKKRS